MQSKLSLVHLRSRLPVPVSNYIKERTLASAAQQAALRRSIASYLYERCISGFLSCRSLFIDMKVVFFHIG